MDFTNINDPAGVQALLDQLRTSQAWKELNNEWEATPPPVSHTNPSIRTLQASIPEVIQTPSLEPEPESESLPSVSNHISSLLSQLQPGGSSGPSFTVPSSRTPDLRSVQQDDHIALQPRDTTVGPSLTTTPSPLRTKDPRFLNFNQALPIIARLSENVEFMEKLEKLQADQTCLERRLWEERTQKIKAQEEKVEVTQAKALILGTGISQNDAKMLRASFDKELKSFDREQVLAAWDALIARQQAILEAYGVPGMFATNLFADREKQQRIVQVLDGLSDPRNDDMEP